MTRDPASPTFFPLAAVNGVIQSGAQFIICSLKYNTFASLSVFSFSLKSYIVSVLPLGLSYRMPTGLNQPFLHPPPLFLEKYLLKFPIDLQVNFETQSCSKLGTRCIYQSKSV